MRGGAGNDDIEADDGTASILEGGPGDDTLTGGDQPDTIRGGAGDDEIDARGEPDPDPVLDADTVEAGSGDDVVRADLRNGETLDGGSGIDLLDILISPPDRAAAGTTTINLATGDMSNEDGVSAQAVNFENLVATGTTPLTIFGSDEANEITGELGHTADTLIIHGGKGDDLLRSDSNAIIQFFGGDGDDLLRTTGISEATLDGGDGDDVIEAIAGTNHLTGGDGADSITGGRNDDRIVADLDDLFLDGGNGIDTLDLFKARTGGHLFIDVTQATQIFRHGANSITIGGFEDLVGRDGGNDTLVTTYSALGLGGADVIARAFVADGGSGVDTYIFDNDVTIDLVVDLSAATDQAINASEKITGFENVTTSSGDDTITGSFGANILSGGAGNDRFLGLDHLDSVIGGTGNDMADFSASAFGMTVDLSDGAISFSNGSTASAREIEDIKGSDGGADTITANGTGSRIDGLGGDDRLTGRAGRDELLGGDGNDEINAGAGDDDVEAGAGDDDVTLGAGDDTADLGDGDDYVDTGDGKDIVNGGAGNDVIIGHGNSSDPDALLDDNFGGGDGNDTLVGGDGDDMLRGDAGDDRLEAGNGFDTVEGGEGADTFVLIASGGTDYTDFDATEDFIEILGLAFDDITIVEGWDGFAELRLPSGKRVFTQSRVGDLTPDRFVTAATTNARPIATDDSVSTRQDNAITIEAETLLDNDNDSDGDTLTILRVSEAKNGAVSLAGDGTITFTPSQGFAGSASFSYEITDGQGGTDDAIVHVEVAAPAPGDNGTDATETGDGGDQTTLGGGAEILRGSLDDLDGDTVSGFSTDDQLIVTGDQITRGAITVTLGSAILEIDADGDGAPDATITLDGDFTGGDFMAVSDGADTWITFESFLPDLADAQSVASGEINGVNNQRFLTGDGSTEFKVTLQDVGFALFNNVLGVYEIDSSGDLVDARILFDNANADKTASTIISDVDAGHMLGFFLMQDAADWATRLASTDTLSFVNSTDGVANLSDGADLQLLMNGADVDALIYHSYAANMNPTGLTRVLSGVDVGGQSILIGFEDATNGGDRDYEDVLFRVELVDA